MPVHIIIVHDDTDFLERVAAALRAAGHQVACCSDSMAALSALHAAERTELLITRLNFSPGKPNGISLALMARRKRPGITVLFIAPEEMREFTKGTGEFMPAPVGIADLLDTVWRLAAPPPQGAEPL